MLIEFTVGNFRSIANNVTLSLVASSIKSGSHASHLDEDNIIHVDSKLALLKSVAIYGANASGKSNILRALRTMGLFMRMSVRHADGDTFPYSPFLLIEGYQFKPSHFEIVFLIDGVQYRYGFDISATRVEREWLYFCPNSREALLFDRVGDSIKPGDYFKGAKGLESRVAPKALFLTVARDFNVARAEDIFRWMSRFPSMSGLDDTPSGFTIRCLNEKDSLAADVVEFMRQLNIGISDIELKELPASTDSDEPDDAENRPKRYRVDTVHTYFDGEGNPASNVRLNMKGHESDGTQKLFAMAGRILHVLRYGNVLAVDEMDARLHPALTRIIVEMFHSKQTNSRGAQILFATHDTNLLDNRLMRRDQIWFTEKDQFGATDLYSLADLRVRNDSTYETDYIDGRYGAIPYSGGISRLLGDPEAQFAAPA